MVSLFITFFGLGLISFGGPAAHLSYFRRTFVEQKAWLTEQDYAQLVALSQILPGPGSSQVGFAIGYRRAGLAGAILAFLGFTTPSVLIMSALAYSSQQLGSTENIVGLIMGLKLLAVVVVADACYNMFKSFCHNRLTTMLAIGSTILLLLQPGMLMQLFTLFMAMLLSNLLSPTAKVNTTTTFRVNRSALWLFLALFSLSCLPLWHDWPALTLFGDFFYAGSLVFGGGHVVLPLLQQTVGDLLPQDQFLTGYALAQAIPGPMFSFATYLGYLILPATPVLGAICATAGVFLPGFLLLLAVLKHWQSLVSRPRVKQTLNGVNAAVVGLLVAALYDPILTSAVKSAFDMAMVILGWWMLRQKTPIVWLVMLFAGTGLFVY